MKKRTKTKSLVRQLATEQLTRIHGGRGEPTPEIISPRDPPTIIAVL